MFFALLLSAVLLGADGPPSAMKPAENPALLSYREALAKTGKRADEHVRLALWCEARGLTAERLKQLSLAVLYEPTNALARGLMGLVSYQGRWVPPDVAGERIQKDPARHALIKEYLDRRARAADTADAQMKLAAWCEEKGLKEQAIAHYTAVTRIAPGREAAWKHLGYKKQAGRWVKPEEAAAAKQEAVRQKQADKHWKPILERLRDGLESKDAAKRARAEQGLADVTDPRAVPMIWVLFMRGDERLQIAAVQMLGQIDGASASTALAALAVFSSSGEVRRRATGTLTRRDPREVVGRLISLIRKPFKYQVRHVNGPGSPGELFVEGERFNIDRFYQNLRAVPNVAQNRLYMPDVPFDPFSASNIWMAMAGNQVGFGAGNFGGFTGFGGNMLISAPGPGLSQAIAQAGQAMAANPQNAAGILGQIAGKHPNLNGSPGFMLEARSLAAQRDLQIGLQLLAVQQSNFNLEQMLARDVQFIENANASINLYDDRTLPVLTAITGQDLGVEPEKWQSWWTDQLGYAFQSSMPETKPTYTQLVIDPMPTFPSGHGACFAAGTPVHTVDGPRSIESLRVGDRVLSQDTSTGQLVFQPVIATHRTPSNSTLRLAVGGESIVATGIHRFWRAGKGWTMARELKPGDRLRIVGGTAEVESIVAGETQPVYNLDVADDRDFFVGAKGILVHDFTFVEPVLEPFDRQADLRPPVPISK